MAITLQLTDGTTTVNLNNRAAGLYVLDGNYINVGGGPADVDEVWTLAWASGVDTDTRADNKQDITYLLNKAATHYRMNLIDRAVWLVFQPEGATNAQYAKVKGGIVGPLSSQVIAERNAATMTVALTREHAWRSAAPDGTAGDTEVNAVTIYNKQDGDGNNHVTIDTTRENDRPALLDITVDLGSMSPLPDTMLIGVRRDISTTELGKFTAHFRPSALVSNGGGTQVADAAASGDFRLELTADGQPYWEITDTNIDTYAGNYDVYFAAYIGAGSGEARVRFKTDLETGQYKTLSSSATQNLIYMGEFNLPGTDINPFVAVNTSSDLKLYFDYDEVSGTPTTYLYGMFIVPTDIPPFACDFTVAANDEVVVNGVDELTYVTDSSGNQKISAQVTVRGRYPTSEGRSATRLYFYFWGAPSGDYLTRYTPNNSATVTVQVVDRFASIRGAA